jgi:hypothetical protein
MPVDFEEAVVEGAADPSASAPQEVPLLQCYLVFTSRCVWFSPHVNIKKVHGSQVDLIVVYAARNSHRSFHIS